MIQFNKPHFSGKEQEYISDAVNATWISGNGKYTKLCHDFFKTRYHFRDCLLTTSCTDALEMAAILIDIQPGDEVIMPSYTFVSTANAFVLRGAKIVFTDSLSAHPNIDTSLIESLITERTKAIVPVHYAGMACEMDSIMEIARKYDLFVIEDAAQAIDSYYKNKPLGSIGHLAAFSFHETKNITCGEGGLLVINESSLIKRAETIWEKGTSRSAFFRGEVDKYGWVDIGSSFLPSDMLAAFLYAQLENIEDIQRKRMTIWNCYHKNLQDLESDGHINIPRLFEFGTNNAHMFFITVKDGSTRTDLLKYLSKNEIHAVFHYLSLHSSEFYKSKHDGRPLPNCDRFSETLIRLPFYYDLEVEDIEKVTSCVNQFFYQKSDE